MEKWAEGVIDLEKFTKRHPQMAYAGLGMPLQLEWQYLQKTVPGVVSLMELIESDIREDPPHRHIWRGGGI